MPVRMDDLLKQYVNRLKAYPFYANVEREGIKLYEAV